MANRIVITTDLGDRLVYERGVVWWSFKQYQGRRLMVDAHISEADVLAEVAQARAVGMEVVEE